MTPRHQTARELAAKGIPVFPLKPDGKTTVTSHGFKDETTDLSLISEWWSKADFNIGVRPFHMGLVAIDLDLKKPDGVSQAVLDILPATRTHATPHGGEHRLYATAEKFGNAVLAVNVDVRSEKGYILWPPSTVDGVEYSVVNDREAMPLPADVADRLRGKAQDVEATPYDDIGLDVDPEGARGFCARLAGKDYDRFALAAALVRNFGLTDATASALCLEYGLRTWTANNGSTTWEATLRNARKYGKGELGEGVAFRLPDVDGDPATFDVFIPKVEKPKNRFGGRDPEEAANRPPIAYWDKYKTLPKGPAVGFAIGLSGSHKSGIFLKYALDIIEAGGRVLFIAAEGAYGIETARLPKAREARNMPWAPLKAGWRTETEAFNLLRPEDHELLFEAYRDFAPSAIFVDVIAKVVADDINEPKVGMAIMNAAQQLASRFDCPIIFAHHPPLADPNRGMGSSFLHSLADFEWIITKNAGKAWLTVSKMKDGPAEFTVPFAIDTKGGAPVIKDCEKTFEIPKQEDPSVTAIKSFLIAHKAEIDLKGLQLRLREKSIIPYDVEDGAIWLLRFIEDGKLDGFVIPHGKGYRIGANLLPRGTLE
jgi:hypothetical protein